MHNEAGSNFIWLVPIAFALLGVGLGWKDVKLDKKAKQQEQKASDMSLLTLAITNLDITNSSEISSPEVSHQCDSGSHMGSFDSGCSSHH